MNKQLLKLLLSISAISSYTCSAMEADQLEISNNRDVIQTFLPLPDNRNESLREFTQRLCVTAKIRDERNILEYIFIDILETERYELANYLIKCVHFVPNLREKPLYVLRTFKKVPEREFLLNFVLSNKEKIDFRVLYAIETSSSSQEWEKALEKHIPLPSFLPKDPPKVNEDILIMDPVAFLGDPYDSYMCMPSSPPNPKGLEQERVREFSNQFCKQSKVDSPFFMRPIEYEFSRMQTWEERDETATLVLQALKNNPDLSALFALENFSKVKRQYRKEFLNFIIEHDITDQVNFRRLATLSDPQKWHNALIMEKYVKQFSEKADKISKKYTSESVLERLYFDKKVTWAECEEVASLTLKCLKLFPHLSVTSTLVSIDKINAEYRQLFLTFLINNNIFMNAKNCNDVLENFAQLSGPEAWEIAAPKNSVFAKQFKMLELERLQKRPESWKIFYTKYENKELNGKQHPLSPPEEFWTLCNTSIVSTYLSEFCFGLRYKIVEKNGEYDGYGEWIPFRSQHMIQNRELSFRFMLNRAPSFENNKSWIKNQLKSLKEAGIRVHLINDDGDPIFQLDTFLMNKSNYAQCIRDVLDYFVKTENLPQETISTFIATINPMK